MKGIRRFLTQFLGDQFYCGLDIGTHKLKASLSRVADADTLELQAVNEVETRGLAGASINDIGEFSSCVSAVIDGIARRTKRKVRDIHLGLGGEFVDMRLSRALVPLVERGNKIVSEKDLRYARGQARMLGVRLEEEVLTDIVQQYKIDDVNIAFNPAGLYGRKLEVETLLVLANITRLRNLTKAVQQAGFEVNDIHFNGVAASDAMLDKRRRTEGCVFIDFGARTTMILVFKEGLLKHFRKVAVGGELLTQRIAAELNIPFVLAEDIKKSYGYVELPDTSPEAGRGAGEEILVKKEQVFVPVKRARITRAVEPDINTLIGHMRAAVTESGYEGQLKGGIVVVGGGALLAGVMERVEFEMRMPVTLGRNIPGLNTAAVYCVSTSIAEAGYKKMFRYRLDSQKPKDLWTAARNKAIEISNEYF